MTTWISAARFAHVAVAAAVATLGAAGCGPNYSVTMYRPIATPKVLLPEQVQLFSGTDLPACPFDEVGLVTTDGANALPAELMMGIRKRVGAAGGDGVIRLQKGVVGSVESQGWEGTIYVCK